MPWSPRYHFSDWPNPDLPAVAAGVYAIWQDDVLFYCGMSGRQLEKAKVDGKRQFGLVTRLKSHALGRLSGDQFCVYVANRWVIPNLKQEELNQFATGELNLDTLTRDFIRSYLDYQFILVETSAEAYIIEGRARRGELFAQKPLLNPL